jgi:hypothetical protein
MTARDPFGTDDSNRPKTVTSHLAQSSIWGSSPRIGQNGESRMHIDPSLPIECEDDAPQAPHMLRMFNRHSNGYLVPP